MIKRRNYLNVQSRKKKNKGSAIDLKRRSGLHIRKAVCVGHEAWPPRGGEPCNRNLLAPLIFSGARIPGFPIGISLQGF